MTLAFAILGCSSTWVASQDPELELRKLGFVLNVKHMEQRSLPTGRDSCELWEQLAKKWDGTVPMELLNYGFDETDRETADDALTTLEVVMPELWSVTNRPRYGERGRWDGFINHQVSHSLLMKSVAKVHLRLALMAAEDGRNSDLTASLKAVMTIVRHFYDVPGIGTPIAFHVEMLLHRIVPKLATRLVDNPDGIPVLRNFVETVREPENMVSLKMSVAFNLAIIDGLADGTTKLSNMVGEEAREIDDRVDFNDYYPVIRDRYLAVELRFARAWGDHRKVIKAYEMYEEEQGEDEQNIDVLIPRLVLSQLVGPMPLVHELEQKARARTRISKIGLAAIQARIESGVWPSLVEAAKIARVSVLDPFGETLHYVVTGDSLTLYSNGSDMRDDGAEPRADPKDPYDEPIVTFRMPSEPTKAASSGLLARKHYYASGVAH